MNGTIDILDAFADKIEQANTWCHTNLEPGTWKMVRNGFEVKFKFDRDQDHLMFILGNKS
jgi:hypothetical protein